MGKIKELLLKEQRCTCPDCNGYGVVEYEVERPHAGGFNMGFIDTEMGTCEMCDGAGEIDRPCFGCGEAMLVSDGSGDYCLTCREEEQKD
jgi:DnaJ-class molecular chaperone